MLHNNIVNLLMHTPIKRVLLPVSQKRLALPLPNYIQYESNNDQYEYKLRPYEFSCLRGCSSLLKCIGADNSSIRCSKEGSLERSIKTNTYDVFNYEYLTKIDDYNYSGTRDSFVEEFSKVINKKSIESKGIQEWEKYYTEINVLLYSLKDLKVENEYGLFIKTHKKLLFFKNNLLNFNKEYTKLKLINLDDMKNYQPK
jgi:hypothetical protein